MSNKARNSWQIPQPDRPGRHLARRKSGTLIHLPDPDAGAEYARHEITDEEVVAAIKSVPMHFASTTFYLRSTVAAQPGTLPSDWGGTYTNIWNSSYQHSLETTPGSSQQTFHSSYTPAVTNGSTDNAGSGQFITHNNLLAGSYGTGTWTMGFAGKLTTIPAGAQWTYRIGIFLFDSTGTLKTTIAASQNGSGANTTANTELTTYSASISGSAFTIASGDYLVFEIGIFFTNNSGSTWNTGIGNCYDSGTTPISSDGATIASAQSFIQAPFMLAPGPNVVPDHDAGHSRVHGPWKQEAPPAAHWWCSAPRLPWRIRPAFNQRRSGLWVPRGGLVRC